MNNKEEQTIYDKISKMSINYGTDSLLDKYRELAKDIDIEELVNYGKVKNKNAKYASGILHVVLSVKVDDTTPFIPFVSISGPNQDDLKKMVKNLQSQGTARINYNYSEFVDDLEKAENRQLKRISFEIHRKNGKYFLVNGRLISEHDNPDKLWLEAQDDDEKGRQVNSLMCHLFASKNGKRKPFAKEIAKEYYDTIKVEKLCFSIFSVDVNYDGGKCLTKLMLISTTPNEIDFYLKRRLDRIREFVSCIRTKYTYDLIQKNKWEALKSAVSAIMSRNMSHNLGSHYLYYTKSYLEDLANHSESLGPDIRGAAKVLGYMQARMDYLATVISNDRYPNGAVNFKSQLYDELTVDDFSKRHFSKDDDKYRRTTNFLLANLVKSENFTRPSIGSSDSPSKQQNIEGDFMPISLCVKLWNEEKGKFELFTGLSDEKIQDKETEVKNKLSKINIALPGGSMSAHAFFNVVENFIRNSAKYLREDFNKEGLVFTIAIKRNETDNQFFDIVIYDNKKNASKVLPILAKQLQELTILDETGSIEKSAKGIKEMLFSSVWMRSYNYPKETFVDIIHRIQDEENPDEKIKLIEYYGFKFVKVSNNLGMQITLPEFSRATEFQAKESDTEKDIIANCLKISSDIVCIPLQIEETLTKHSDFATYFTRLFHEKDYDLDAFRKFVDTSRVIDKSDEETAQIAYRFKSILDSRFNKETDGNIDNVCLQIGGGRRDIKRIPRDNKYIVYFERHLNNKGFDNFYDFAYVDSISGGNFTITLNSLLDQGITKSTCEYITWSDKLLGLKIKESALTRITLIDERLFNSMESDGDKRKLELALKNIRVLNANIEKEIKDVENLEDLLEGNKFMDGSDSTHFLSIHLGLIEKIVKSDWGRKKYGEDSKLEDNVTRFMEDLQRIFGNGKRVYISVHSGRGNFSKELEGPLATYPFISLSAIENAFNNSKYLLAQLFYNTIYIGKGKINE